VAQAQGRVSSCTGPGPRARSGVPPMSESTIQILMLAATVLWPRSILRFSFDCGLRPHAKLNPRTPLTPGFPTLNTSPSRCYFVSQPYLFHNVPVHTNSLFIPNLSFDVLFVVPTLYSIFQLAGECPRKWGRGFPFVLVYNQCVNDNDTSVIPTIDVFLLLLLCLLGNGLAGRLWTRVQRSFSIENQGA